jgi:hypothetical protein
MNSKAYAEAQLAVASLKSVIYELLMADGNRGMRTAEIAKTLGLRGGVGPHDNITQIDWIPRTILSMMEREEVLEKKDQLWFVRQH